MIFAHTLEKVVQGTKWQTRRLVKSNESFDSANQSVIKSGKRTIYKIGKSYAVQPNRGKKSVARIQLTGLRKEAIEAITEVDAKAEGFSSREDFLATWREIHGQDTDLSSEVWVLEFELCAIVDETFRILYENRDSAHRSIDNSYDLSPSVAGIPGIGMYSRGH